MQTISTKNLSSADPTITLPTEIHVQDDGRAVACHSDSGDVVYADIGALAEAYQIDLVSVEDAELAEACGVVL